MVFVCELETKILLAAVRLRGSRQGDLSFVEKGELGTSKKDIAEIERMLKALIQSLEKKHLNPLPLESLDPLLQLNWRRNINLKVSLSCKFALYYAGM